MFDRRFPILSGEASSTVTMPLYEYDRLREERRQAEEDMQKQRALVTTAFAAYEAAVRVAVAGLGYKTSGSYVYTADGRTVFYTRRGALGDGFRVEPPRGEPEDPNHPMLVVVPGDHEATVRQLLDTLRFYLTRPAPPAPRPKKRSR